MKQAPIKGTRIQGKGTERINVNRKQSGKKRTPRQCYYNIQKYKTQMQNTRRRKNRPNQGELMNCSKGTEVCLSF
jgi:hypothetical protein